MRVNDVDNCIPEQRPAGAPILLRQKPSSAALAGLGLAATTACGLLLAPFWLVIARAIADPGVIADLAAHPLSVIQLALALLLALLIVGFALRRLFHLAGRRREVFVEAGVVSVVDHRFGRQQRWQQPVAAYCGLARTVRSGVSGVRHQIVLVHPDASRHVVLAVSGRPDAAAFAELLRDLGLPEVSHHLISPTARIEQARNDIVPADAGRLAA